jgi:hypothetical protein
LSYKKAKKKYIDARNKLIDEWRPQEKFIDNLATEALKKDLEINNAIKVGVEGELKNLWLIKSKNIYDVLAF